MKTPTGLACVAFIGTLAIARPAFAHGGEMAAVFSSAVLAGLWLVVGSNAGALLLPESQRGSLAQATAIGFVASASFVCLGDDRRVLVQGNVGSARGNPDHAGNHRCRADREEALAVRSTNDCVRLAVDAGVDLRGLLGRARLK